MQDNITGMNIDTTTLSTSHRNNQIICNLANQMYPDMKPCDSTMNEKTGHDGIFWIKEKILIVIWKHIIRYSLDMTKELR